MAKREWTTEEWWRALLMDDDPPLPGRRLRNIMRFLPGASRCKFCYAPQHGALGPLMQMIGKGPSRLTPHFCKQCEDLAGQHIGGAQLEVSLMFADMRGSTALAEQVGPARFSELIGRFFGVAANALMRHGAMVDKLVGDQASGMFVPGFAGPGHRQQALDAALELLHATGHHSPEGPWIPVGIGVHTGVAFIGAVGAKGQAVDVTVLGDPPNVAARLASAAAAGEILVTREAASDWLDVESLERRELTLKGKSQTVGVYVLSNAA
jgi:adenylate cyclase